MTDASDSAFDTWWPSHAVKHNSRSPTAAREAFDAGWDAAIEASARLAEEQAERGRLISKSVLLALAGVIRELQP